MTRIIWAEIAADLGARDNMSNKIIYFFKILYLIPFFLFFILWGPNILWRQISFLDYIGTILGIYGIYIEFILIYVGFFSIIRWGIIFVTYWIYIKLKIIFVFNFLPDPKKNIGNILNIYGTYIGPILI